MSLTLNTAPTEEAVSLTELKTHSRITITDDDDYVTALGTAARRKLEKDTGLALCTQTWTEYLDGFPDSCSDAILVSKPPLQSVTHIKYVDTSGNIQTWASAQYQVDIYSVPGRIVPAYGYVWPSVRSMLNAVEIKFVAGYGRASAIPEELRHAIKLLVGTWYEHREVVITGTIMTQMPAPIAYGRLIDPFVVHSFR